LKKLDRQLYYIHSTEEILKDLNNCIRKKKPFSVMRFGDACLGIMCSFLAPNFIKHGKWKGGQKCGLANSIFRQLGVPVKRRKLICNKLVKYANEANYIDSFDCYFTEMKSKKGIGNLAFSWKEIHELIGITNESYCSTFLHYFSIVDGEYNLFNVMKNRSVFCISNQVQVTNLLKDKSGAKIIDSYKIPRRGGKFHYQNHYRNVINMIKKNSTKYDLFLIGAGLLGKIYCGVIKENGGRAYDVGRLFDFWAGIRKIDSRPKRFIQMDHSKFLCNRLKNFGGKVW